MKVGILGHGFINWGGGVDFLRLVAESLVAEDPSIEIHFLFPISGPMYHARQALKTIRRTALHFFDSRYTIKNSDGKFDLHDYSSSLEGNISFHLIDIGDGAIQKAAKDFHLDVVLPSIKPLTGQDVPWIGYLHDYQHAYFPEFFSPSEVASRNKKFSLMLSSSRFVLVNARAVADDVRKFNPESSAKIIALPFAAAPNRRWLLSAPETPEQYGLSGKYFVISNQFWQHKDHITAWRALAIVLRTHPEVVLVCTGETHDYRKPDYFRSLMKVAQDLGIDHRLHILGLLPKSEQIGLVRAATAMVQPSLFEGGPGGGAVFDAVSLGVPCIVSDIKVNRELHEPSVLFFKAGDPTSLAEKMIEMLESESYRVQLRKSPATLLSEGRARRRRCGREIVSTINDAIRLTNT